MIVMRSVGGDTVAELRCDFCGERLSDLGLAHVLWRDADAEHGATALFLHKGLCTRVIAPTWAGWASLEMHHIQRHIEEAFTTGLFLPDLLPDGRDGDDDDTTYER